MSEWISVKDRLPQGFWDESRAEQEQQRGMEAYSELVNVLADNGKVAAAWYNRETKKWCLGYGIYPNAFIEFTNTSVTHWQPLPLP